MDHLPVVDSHVHLWDPQQFHMPWLADLPLLNQSYDLERYQEETQGLPITSLVYVEVGVEPIEALLEANWIIGLAQSHELIQAIVAAAPLEQGLAVQTYLQSLKDLGPLIKGVRRNLQDEVYDFCLQPTFIEGTRLLADYGLSCDICINHRQLAEIVELVRQCPDTTFVLDHLGKPAIKQGQLDPWQQQVRDLAALPNVFCKISGMVTEADHQSWQTSDLIPYIETVLESFGENRVMFGGDWPVILLASPYNRWYEIVDELIGQASLEAQSKFWSENARDFYRLENKG